MVRCCDTLWQRTPPRTWHQHRQFSGDKLCLGILSAKNIHWPGRDTDRLINTSWVGDEGWASKYEPLFVEFCSALFWSRSLHPPLAPSRFCVIAASWEVWWNRTGIIIRKTGDVIWIKPWCKLSLLVIKMRHLLRVSCIELRALAAPATEDFWFLSPRGAVFQMVALMSVPTTKFCWIQCATLDLINRDLVCLMWIYYFCQLEKKIFSQPISLT